MIQRNRNKRLETQIKSLPSSEKFRLLDVIIQDLDKPNPDIEAIWVKEAQKRLRDIRSGKSKTYSHAAVMAKLRSKR